jgi:hypothetical protein
MERLGRRDDDVTVNGVTSDDYDSADGATARRWLDGATVTTALPVMRLKRRDSDGATRTARLGRRDSVGATRTVPRLGRRYSDGATRNAPHCARRTARLGRRDSDGATRTVPQLGRRYSDGATATTERRRDDGVNGVTITTARHRDDHDGSRERR